MNEHSEPSRSESEPGDERRFEPGGAQRFWGEYSRQTRAGREGGEPPGAGPGNGQGGPQGASHDHECLEWCPICRTADVLRASASPELRGQVQGLQRDALVTLRELLDAYIERLGEPQRRSTQVEDIPIE